MGIKWAYCEEISAALTSCAAAETPTAMLSPMSHDESWAHRYLDRIAASWPSRLDAASLRALQWQHLRTVPFENLSIHLNETIVLDNEWLLEKIVARRRGGICYELNGAFGWLLTTLGFDVTILAASTIDSDVISPPFDHMALRVELDEPWLVDVGFGRFAHYPLRLAERNEQLDPAAQYQVSEAAHQDLEITENGKPKYRLESRPRTLSDFGPTCWFQQTSPQSYFAKSPLCTMPTSDGRITLSNNTLIHTVDGERRLKRFSHEADIRSAYQEHFDITLNRLPPTTTKSSR